MNWFAYDPSEKDEELSDEELDGVSGGAGIPPKTTTSPLLMKQTCLSQVCFIFGTRQL
jgi:hypothetical protein